MHCWQQAFRRASHAFTDGTDGLICDVCVSHRSGFVVFKHRECVWFYEIWITQINIITKYTVLREIPFQSHSIPWTLQNLIFIDLYFSHQNVLLSLHFISWNAIYVILLVSYLSFSFFFFLSENFSDWIATPLQPFFFPVIMICLLCEPIFGTFGLGPVSKCNQRKS